MGSPDPLFPHSEPPPISMISRDCAKPPAEPAALPGISTMPPFRSKGGLARPAIQSGDGMRETGRPFRRQQGGGVWKPAVRYRVVARPDRSMRNHGLTANSRAQRMHRQTLSRSVVLGSKRYYFSHSRARARRSAALHHRRTRGRRLFTPAGRAQRQRPGRAGINPAPRLTR